jgi:putative transposase
VEEDMEVRSAIQLIFAEHKRRYGYRRVSAELRRRGMLVNHKRVWRLMREDRLLGVQWKALVVTTESDHELEVYLNLASRMKLSGVNQLWVADITYIRLQEEFAYLAIILDAFSRRVIGWAMADHLGASLAVTALTMALTARRPSWGSLVHHSDRGVQYACAEYTRLLDAHGIAASMSRVGNPYDNAKAERFIRTLKGEEIDGTRYRDHRDAAGHLGAFIDQVYNRQRLHSALDYQTPVAFEAEHRARSRATAPLTTVGFQGIRKSTVMPDAQPTP